MVQISKTLDLGFFRQLLIWVLSPPGRPITLLYLNPSLLRLKSSCFPLFTGPLFADELQWGWSLRGSSPLHCLGGGGNPGSRGPQWPCPCRRGRRPGRFRRSFAAPLLLFASFLSLSSSDSSSHLLLRSLSRLLRSRLKLLSPLGDLSSPLLCSSGRRLLLLLDALSRFSASRGSSRTFSWLGALGGSSFASGWLCFSLGGAMWPGGFGGGTLGVRLSLPSMVSSFFSSFFSSTFSSLLSSLGAWEVGSTSPAWSSGRCTRRIGRAQAGSTRPLGPLPHCGWHPPRSCWRWCAPAQGSEGRKPCAGYCKGDTHTLVGVPTYPESQSCA